VTLKIDEPHVQAWEGFHGRMAHEGSEMMSCPQCGAPAEVREKGMTPCHTWEAINSGPITYVTEADEVLMIVEVNCAAGHRFAGPAEMLLGTAETTGWEERIA
jgi:hypothetical protein